MRTRRSATVSRPDQVLAFLFVTSFLMVWVGFFFVAVFAAGGADAAYALVRWLAGLGPE
jgi:hypothetical protein